MSFFSFLSQNFSGPATSQKRNRRKTAYQFNFESLEQRRLLAGITLNTATKDLTIFGDNANDVGRIDLVGGQYRAQLAGVPDQLFATSQVDKVIFIGYNGNDEFTNNTGLEGEFAGHGGNDTLRGGSGYDFIDGGEGNDTITGGDGNDKIVGSTGSDNISGGAGNDEIFGSFTGTNVINGDDGDDVIFGGNAVDNINGGNGIDKIYALDGDDTINSGAGGIPSNDGNDVAAQGDLVLGLNGVDRITGGGGWDVIYGGDDGDIITGGDGQNWIFGQDGNDRISGGANNDVGGVTTIDYLRGGNGDDTIYGNAGIDVIFGEEGNDLLHGGFGDDIINGWRGNDEMIGGGGNDIADINGNPGDYKITGTDSRQVTRDKRANTDGQDTLNFFDTFRFVSGDQPAALNSTLRVVINPIIVANSDGSNRSEFFGDAASELYIKDLIDFTMWEAGVDVLWGTAKNWNNSFANIGTGGTRPTSHLGQVTDSGDAAGIGSSDTRVVDMYFVEVAAGYGDTGENTVNGLAWEGSSGLTLAVGDNLLTSENGREAVARVAAHEIAHNLGLDHISSPSDNLMLPGPTGTALTAAQKAIIRASSLTVPF